MKRHGLQEEPATRYCHTRNRGNCRRLGASLPHRQGQGRKAGAYRPATAPYFPPGAIWTQDVSHAPVDPQSTAIIDWLADAGGWGHSNQLASRLDHPRCCRQTPPLRKFPFTKVRSLSPPIPTCPDLFPFPPEAAWKDRAGYQCDIDHMDDCHLHRRGPQPGQALRGLPGQLRRLNVLPQNSLRYGTSTAFIRRRAAEINAPAPMPPVFLSLRCSSMPMNSPQEASTTPFASFFPIRRIRAHVFVHPATHAGAPRGPDTAPPMGVRFRLKASYDLSQLTPAAQVVARAMQKYGMFLSDAAASTSQPRATKTR